MKIFTALVTLLFVFSGCVTEKSRHYPAGVPISFESSVHQAYIITADEIVGVASRIADSDGYDLWWNDYAGWPDDAGIGVYMFYWGGEVSDNSLGVNALHRHAGDGGFRSAAGHELFYPQSGRVNFAAYHPYRQSVTGHTLPVDTSDQTDPAIDILYAKNTTGCSRGDVPLLQFRHMFSRLVFDLRSEAGSSVNGLTASISRLYMRGEFDLATGKHTLDTGSRGAFAPVVASVGGSAVRIESTVLPQAEAAPVLELVLENGSTTRLAIPGTLYQAGKIYLYNVFLTASGELTLTGDATITDWNDADGNPNGSTIPKTGPEDSTGGDIDEGDSDDGGDGDAPGGNNNNNNAGGDESDDANGDEGNGDAPLPDETVQYFFETMGQGTADSATGATWPEIDSYTGWDNPSPVTFSDRFGGARVCRAGDLDTHIFFPPAVDADLLVAGLPAGYRDITLSYQIASVGTGNVRANLIRVYAGSVNLTSSVTVGTALPDRYVGVSIDLPDGVTSLRFVSDGGTNIHGMRLDNIRLSGRR